jgi:hypothetical protein
VDKAIGKCLEEMYRERKQAGVEAIYETLTQMNTDSSKNII